MAEKKKYLIKVQNQLIPVSEEQDLMFSIYFEGKTQTELEAEAGVKQQTISYRELKIRKKLKKMLEK